MSGLASGTRKEQIVRSLASKEYRDAFVEAHIDEGLAFQIREMRELRGWTQAELAERAGMKQERISRLEDPNYGRHTGRTLKRLASAFDVALIIRFELFSDLAEHVADLSTEDVAVPPFSTERGDGGTE